MARVQLDSAVSCMKLVGSGDDEVLVAGFRDGFVRFYELGR